MVDLETTDIALYVGKHQNAYFGAWFDLNQILRRIVKRRRKPADPSIYFRRSTDLQ